MSEAREFGPLDSSDVLAQLARQLEAEHFGAYVMMEPLSGTYVLGDTASDVHARFLQTFGPETRGECARIGVSPFAAA